jgi:ribonuclease BN (tRNA processing enzyme)
MEVFVRQRIAAGAAGRVEDVMAHMRADHTSAEDAGRIAQEAGVKTLVLSHIGPPFVSDEAWQAGSGKHFRGDPVRQRRGMAGWFGKTFQGRDYCRP